MKKILSVLMFCFIVSGLNAQLADTKWKAIANVPEPMEVIFDFEKDVMNLYLADGITLLESSAYKLQNDTLSINKISGGSPCNNETIGTYKFEIRDEKLFITLIDDACSERKNSVSTEGMVRLK